MLLDRNLVLFDGTGATLAASGSPSGNWIDVSNLGLDSQQMFAYVLFKTEMDAATSFSWGFQSASDVAFGSGTVLAGIAIVEGP